MQTSGPEKSRTKNKRADRQPRKVRKKRREEEIRKRQSKNKRKKPTRNTSHKHQDTITTSQQGKTRATNRNIANKATNLRNENATKQRTATTHTSAKHHPEWLISTNIRHITRYDVISRNEQTGRLTNKQQKQKTVNKTKSVLFRQKWSLSGANPRNKQKTVQRNLEKRWQV